MHRRIAGAREISELMELRAELEDRFGELAGAAGEPDHAPAGAHQARPRGRDRGHLPGRPAGGHADRARRRDGAPAARGAAGRELRVGALAAVTARARRPGAALPRGGAGRGRAAGPSRPLPKSPVKRSRGTRRAPLPCAAGRRSIFACAGRPAPAPYVHVPFSALLMIKAARLVLSLCALVGVGATVAACGGVPGNAVATVDGESIDKTDFTPLDDTSRRSRPARPNAAVPDPAGLRQVRRGQAQGHPGAGQGPAEGDRRAAQDAVQAGVRRSCATRSCSC